MFADKNIDSYPTSGRFYLTSRSPTRNLSVDEIGERYRFNHAIIVQTACQAVVCETMCLQAACLRNTPQLTS